MRRSPEFAGENDIRRTSVHAPQESFYKYISVNNCWVFSYDLHLLRMFLCHTNDWNMHIKRRVTQLSLQICLGSKWYSHDFPEGRQNKDIWWGTKISVCEISGFPWSSVQDSGILYCRVKTDNGTFRSTSSRSAKSLVYIGSEALGCK